MKNFIIILFTFFTLFLILSAIVTAEPLPLFLAIFLGFFITFICLAYYLSPLLGIIIGLLYIATPFLLEYLGYKFGVPFFDKTMLQVIENKDTRVVLSNLLTLENVFMVFTMPLLFMTALFFGFKIKIFSNIKKYHKTFLTLIMSVLVTLQTLTISRTTINYNEAVKWLIIALVINAFICFLFYSRTNIPRIYKELPIAIYLLIFLRRSLIPFNEFNLIATLILFAIYLQLSYKGNKLRKIKHAEAESA